VGTLPSRNRSWTASTSSDAAAGKRRKEHDTAHGTQKGDPAKAAQALITAVESSDPPALLLLGQDALHLFRQILDAQQAEVQAWEKITASTGFEG
jgi:hypothetical protein